VVWSLWVPGERTAPELFWHPVPVPVPVPVPGFLPVRTKAGSARRTALVQASCTEAAKN
jgi:hypothetical protein